MKKHIITILKVSFAVSIIYYMIATGKLDLHEIAGIAQKKLMILKVILMLFLSYALINLRWYYLLIWQGIPVTFNAVTRITCIGFFFNNFMPGSIGGDLVKAFYVAKGNKENRTRAVMTILIDRIVGLEALMIVAFTALMLNYKLVSSNPNLKALATVFGMYLLCSLAGAAAVFSRRVKLFFNSIGAGKLLNILPKKEMLIKIYNAFHVYSGQKKRLLKALGISIVCHILAVLIFYTIGRATGEFLVSLASYFTVVPSGLLVLSLPVAPAGIGLGQGAFYNLFIWFGAASGASGATIITIYQIIMVSFNLLFIFVYLRSRKEIKEAMLMAS